MPTARSGDIDIHYTVEGDGPSLVLLHSFLCSGAMWSFQAPALAEHHRVFNIDLRGHGGSGRVERDHSLYDMVADALAVMDSVGVGSAVWVGLSVGGMVALRAGITAPERVAGLILLDTDAASERRQQRARHVLMSWVARATGVRIVLPAVVREMFGPAARRDQPQLVDEWRTRFAAAHVPSLLKVLSAISGRDDVTSQLPLVSAPAFVGVGSEDRLLPPRLSRAIATRLPNAEYREFAGSGHLSALEQPGVVTESMLSFLTGLEGRAASA